jgi:hypothetical protein
VSFSENELRPGPDPSIQRKNPQTDLVSEDDSRTDLSNPKTSHSLSYRPSGAAAAFGYVSPFNEICNRARCEKTIPLYEATIGDTDGLGCDSDLTASHMVAAMHDRTEGPRTMALRLVCSVQSRDLRLRGAPI